MIDPSEQLARFLILAVLIGWPIALLTAWWLRRKWSRRFERLGEASSEEIISELEAAYAPRRSIVIRTQAEYLPFVVECIREQVDSGLDDDQVRCFHDRTEGSRANQQRSASFTVESDGVTDTLTMHWTRDEADRIELRVQAAPRIIEALQAHRKKIPRAKRTSRTS